MGACLLADARDVLRCCTLTCSHPSDCRTDWGPALGGDGVVHYTTLPDVNYAFGTAEQKRAGELHDGDGWCSRMPWALAPAIKHRAAFDLGRDTAPLDTRSPKFMLLTIFPASRPTRNACARMPTCREACCQVSGGWAG
jgi:hypothetical protein